VEAPLQRHGSLVVQQPVIQLSRSKMSLLVKNTALGNSVRTRSARRVNSSIGSVPKDR